MPRFLNQKGFTPLELLFVSTLITITLTIGIPEISEARDAAAESRAKGTLRSIGSSQLAYQGTNNARYYGSYQGMVDSMYIAEGYTLGNMIEQYSLSWQVNNHTDYSQLESGTSTASFNEFTVIAWPYDSRSEFLHTFGICEDQVVRVFNPDDKYAPNTFDSIKTWDPIL